MYGAILPQGLKVCAFMNSRRCFQERDINGMLLRLLAGRLVRSSFARMLHCTTKFFRRILRRHPLPNPHSPCRSFPADVHAAFEMFPLRVLGVLRSPLGVSSSNQHQSLMPGVAAAAGAPASARSFQ